MRVKLSFVALSISALTLAIGSMPAAAACKKMGFVVNDYGKDGPTKDAKELLDKEIAKWAANNGIAKYTVGKKDVKCELFLDVLLFDEHTCTASASVCWNEAGGPPPKAPGDEAAPAKASKAKDKTAPVETGAIEDKPADAKPAAEKSVAPKPESKAPTETPAPAAAAKDDAAERAAAAAERAAAAAERAAAAAEKAASGSPTASAAASAEPAAEEAVSEEAGDLSRQIAPVESDKKP